MVTGRVPFDGDSSVSVALKHVQDPVKPPRELVPTITQNLEKIILKCTQKNPGFRYANMTDLLVDFSIARGNGTIRKLMTQYKKYSLLIIDEWLLYPLKESECRDLLEIMESRYKRASTVLCSQFDIPGWRDKLGDPILADAICDRIVHDSYTIIIGGQESMRKRKGLKDT